MTWRWLSWFTIDDDRTLIALRGPWLVREYVMLQLVAAFEMPGGSPIAR